MNSVLPLSNTLPTALPGVRLRAPLDVKTDSVVYDNMVGNGSYTLDGEDRFDVPVEKIIIEKVEVTKY